MNNPEPEREIDPVTAFAVVVALLFIPAIIVGFFP
jgi:hypothetical protein